MKLNGIMDLPLHSGKAPQWLMQRMKKLAREIGKSIIELYNEKKFMDLISDPLWFQSLGNVLGFDWHSSGLTTTVVAALKSINNLDYEVKIAGGKGKAKEIPKEIEMLSEKNNADAERIKYYSKIAAKVDNALVQDNYNIYVHGIFFTKKYWVVVQQGMKESYARRYHWQSFSKPLKITIEPHQGVVDKKSDIILDLTSKNNEIHQDVSVDLIKDNPKHLFKYFKPKDLKQRTLIDFQYYKMPSHHYISSIDLDKRTKQALMNAYEVQPKNYEELIGIKGIGKKALRALALVSELITAKPLEYRNPVKYSFAHGGKDGTPFPVNRRIYDNTIRTLKEIIENAKLDNKDKERIFVRLSKITKLY